MSRLFMCRKCALVSKKEDLIESSKVSGLSVQASNKLKSCRCGGRIFFEVNNKEK